MWAHTPLDGFTSGRTPSGMSSRPRMSAVPLPVIDVVNKGAGGIRVVCDVGPPSAQLPDEPRVDRPEQEFALFGPVSRIRDVVQEPHDLRPGEIGVQDQARPFAEPVFSPLFEQLVADRRGSPALPHDCVVDRLARGSIPQHRGLTLVRDPDGRDPVRGDTGLAQRLLDDAAGDLPDLFRIVFDPARPGVDLFEFRVGAAHGPPVVIQEKDGGPGGALVDCQHVGTHRARSFHGLLEESPLY